LRRRVSELEALTSEPGRGKEKAFQLEQKTRDLMDSLTIGIAISAPGPEGEVVEVNTALWKIFGYDSELEFLKIPASHHYHDPKERKRFSVLREQGPVKDYEARFKRKDGSLFWGSVSAIPITSEAGTVQFINTFKDITERKQTEETHRRRHAELESINRIIGKTLQEFDLEKRLHAILEEAMAFLGVELGGIHLVQQDQLALRAWKGLSPSFRAHLLSFSSADPPAWYKGSDLLQTEPGEESLLPDFARQEGIQMWASIPLTIPMAEREGKREWLGNIFVASRRYGALKGGDFEAFRKMTGQLALAIDHSRSYLEANRRLVRLDVLKEIDRAIIRRLELKEVLHAALDRVPKELGADAAAISLFKKETGRPKVFAMRLPNGILIDEEAFTIAESLLHWFLERREVVIIYDLTEDPRLQMHRQYINGNGLSCYLGVPLIARDNALGILHILSREPRIYADEDIEFFKIMAGQVAIAIDNALLFDTTRQRALELEEKVNELEQVSESLRESRDRLAEAHRIARMGNWDWDVLQNRSRLSEQTYEIFGVSPDQFAGTYEAFLNSVHPGDRDFFAKAVDGALYKGRDFDLEHRILLPDGSERIIRERAEVTFDKSGKPLRMLGTVQDVTREKELERVARIQEKMASLGHVAAGMAHEIRNPLSGINILLEAIKENLGDPETVEDLEGMIDEAKAAAGKIEAVVKRVMDFSRPSTLQMRLVDINGPIEEAIRLSSVTLQESGIELETDPASDLPRVYADDKLIEQVILNLIFNAQEAMEEISGTKKIFISSHEEGGWIVVRVCDSGPGIPPNVRDKIFEPFYTTKKSGTGIGLSICQRIISDHGGIMEVSASDLGGEDFTIRIPVEKRTMSR